MSTQQTVKLFISYSHEDDDLRKQLEKHLKPLQQQNVIDPWHDRKIGAGAEWQQVIDENLEAADIILLLVSPDFLASDYCFDVEIKRAMQKHEEKSAIVIPVKLRHCDTDGAAFMKLQGLPENLIPVKKWNDPDEAFTDIAKGIRKVAERIHKQKGPALDNHPKPEEISTASIPHQAEAPTATSLLPSVKLGDEFKKFLHKQISAELKRPEAKLLNEELAERFKHDKSAKDLEELIADSLLDGQVDEAISKYLTRASADCISTGGKRRPEVGDKLDLVRKVAEQILGWLVLSSVDENQIQKILPCCKSHESLFFTLGVDSFAGVEIVLSRRFGHKTAWPNKASAEPKSTNLIPSQESWFKWDDKETVRKILIEIWNKVFQCSTEPRDQKLAGDELSKAEIKRLNAALKYRRTDSESPEHYYIAFQSPMGSSVFSENIYHQLLSSLQQMTVVQFGIEGSDNLFLIAEEDVTTVIDEFYRAINNLKG